MQEVTRSLGLGLEHFEDLIFLCLLFIVVGEQTRFAVSIFMIVNVVFIVVAMSYFIVSRTIILVFHDFY